MNSTLIKSVPHGDFAEVSPLVDNWEIKFQTLADQKNLIKFDMYPKQNIPPEIMSILTKKGYQDYILENDRWQHFLVPNSIEAYQNLV